MAPDSLKICFVARNHGSADATGGERDQDIERQISDFRGVIVFMPPDGAQHISCLQPVRLRRRENLASPHQVCDKSAFNSWPGATKQFMRHDRGAPDDKWRPEDLRSKTGGSKVFDVDRGIEDGKLSCA